MKLTARVTRSGKWWAVEVPEVQGLFTQARRLDQVPGMVSDAAELLTGRPADEFDVALEVADRDLSGAVATYREATEESRLAAARASKVSRETVRAFVDRGLPVRDVAELLGVSPQRVSQLTKTG